MAKAVPTSKGLKFKIFLVVFALILFYCGYKIIFSSNVSINADTYYFYVPQTSSPSEVADTLENRGFLNSWLSFKLMADLKKLKQIKPGMYELKNGWSNRTLINHFNEHKPKPTIFITLPAMQSRTNVVAGLCKGSGIHPNDVWRLLNDKKFLKELGGFNKESIFGIFLPRNYRIYKNSSAESLLRRLYQEYLLFWNNERLEKASDMNLKPTEVFTLASIVYSETKLQEEMPIIAGVYVNRLQRNMRLESDPTLVYATKKFDTRRVLHKDKNIISAYNTYKNKGLPPGPIYIVPSWVIDKVLEYDGHDYLYFCANHNLEGGHVFAETYEEHKENAQRYHDRLDDENIF